MSINEGTNSVTGQDANDHQPAYIFTPSGVEVASEPPAKRRRLGQPSFQDISQTVPPFEFEPLLNGLETLENVGRREELFRRTWGETEEAIKVILGEANEDTLAKVTSFVQDTAPTEGTGKVPAGFIATGPNIASQSLLFTQLSERLKTTINGPVVILQSGDTSNFKAALKQIIRDATNQKSTDEEEAIAFGQGKLLNYDLEILNAFVKIHGSHKVVVAFQDSEAFDPSLLADLIILFDSWMDRIPFVLLFGIATSVDLFHERLSRAASRCLYGAQFDVQQTSSIVESIFQGVVAGSKAALRLGPELVSNLIERQSDHVQSVQAFTASLKYAYMCHFYANPLTILLDSSESSEELLRHLQPEHLRTVRVLPSFRNSIEMLLEAGETRLARDLLEDDKVLKREIRSSLEDRKIHLARLMQRIHVLTCAATAPLKKTDLYLKAFKGTLSDSDAVRGVLDSIKRMSPETLTSFVERIQEEIESVSSELGLDGWTDEDPEFLRALVEIWTQVSSLVEDAAKTGQPVRSSYSVHNKGLRTTVIAQKVQLSYEKSILSEEDLAFTAIVDGLSDLLKSYFVFENPQNILLREVWLYDSISTYGEVFTPRPRFAIEQALSAPHNYLPNCAQTVNELSLLKPPTANLYQMYLESGSLINIFDLWTAFLTIVGGEDDEGLDERTALMLFYRGLADLKLLGLVKQSKKKVDHLAKSGWRAL